MSESSFSERGRRLVVEEWDILLITGFMVFMIAQSLTLGQIPRQFPLVFLLFGLVAMIVEIFIVLMPSKYSDPVRRMTTGIAAEMDDSVVIDDDDDDGEGVAEDDADVEAVADDADTDDHPIKKTLGIAIGLVVGFGLLAYLISFLFALPVFVVSAMYLLGDGNATHTVLTIIILLLLVQFVFGDFMNVPVETGELIRADDYLPISIGGLNT